MIKKFAVIILTLFFAVPAFAAAPLITDDTGTQGKGKYQLEVDYAGGVTKQYPGQQVATTLTCGATDNVFPFLIIGIPFYGKEVPLTLMMGSMIHRSRSSGDFSSRNQPA